MQWIVLSLIPVALLSPILSGKIVWKVYPGEIYDKKHKWYNRMRLLLTVLISVLMTLIWLCGLCYLLNP